MSLRIALIGNAASTMLRFRGPLIEALRTQGHEVIAICPAGTQQEESALVALGIRRVHLETMSRQGLNPQSEMILLRDLTTLLRELAPDRVFAYFLKPAIWGSIAAKRAGVPRTVAMIEGMGYAFSNIATTATKKLKQTATRFAILQLIKRAGPSIDHLIVLNEDDAQLLHKKAYIEDSKLTILDGIGIDLNHFAPAPPHMKPVRFVMASRLIREKGIEMFCECAARVKKKYPSAQFQLLGKIDNAPGAISSERLKIWVDSGFIEWPGHVMDVRPYIRQSSVFVLPTLYREGLPRSTMEAMAMARPIITSDMPGARGSITHGVSGFIHPTGDLDSLVAACMHFCDTPRDIERMGDAALSEATRRYDLTIQNQLQIDLIVGPKKSL